MEARRRLGLSVEERDQERDLFPRWNQPIVRATGRATVRRSLTALHLARVALPPSVSHLVILLASKHPRGRLRLRGCHARSVLSAPLRVAGLHRPILPPTPAQVAPRGPPQPP